MSDLTNSDVIAISSGVVALCALGTSIWQGYISRHHNLLSVRPHLEIVVSLSRDEGLRFRLVNGGLGPALLDSVSFIHREQWVSVETTDDYLRLVNLMIPSEKFTVITLESYVPDNHTIINQGGHRSFSEFVVTTRAKGKG